MSDNQSTLRDEAGEVESWFELHLAGVDSVDLTGFYLTDDLAQKTKWAIPSGVTIEGGEVLLFWADNEPTEGPTHVNFTLPGSGGTLALVHPDGTTVLDTWSYGSLAPDTSFGREVDGRSDPVVLGISSPREVNYRLNTAPSISQTDRNIDWPSAGDSVVVTCLAGDDGVLSTVRIVYRADNVVFYEDMFDDGQHGDGAAMDGQYGGTIPAHADGTLVSYYTEAIDAGGVSSRDPHLVPLEAYEYEVGYVPPPLFINEFMADNATIITDEFGEYEDWIEIYNASGTAVDLSGMFLTDDLGEPRKWTFPQGTTIGGGQWLLVWADNEEAQGPLHTNFKLSKDGEQIGLYATDEQGNFRLDSVVFGPQGEDISRGRFPDGTENWKFMPTPTPGAANQ